MSKSKMTLLIKVSISTPEIQMQIQTLIQHLEMSHKLIAVEEDFLGKLNNIGNCLKMLDMPSTLLNLKASILNSGAN